MNKRSKLAVTLTFIASVATAGTWTYSDGVIGDGEWMFTTTVSGDEITVSVLTAVGTSGVLDFRDVEGLDGKKITALANNLIYGTSTLKKSAIAILTEVRLPETLISIGSSAFQKCTALTTVTPFLPDSVTTVLQYAFSDCSALTNDLRIAGITTTGKYAFGGNSTSMNVGKVEIGPNLTEMANNAFYYNVMLTNVVFLGDSSLTNIGDNAFNQCSILPSISIPLSVKHIGSGSFGNMPELSSPIDIRNVESIGSFAFGKTNGSLLVPYFILNSALREIPTNCFRSQKSAKDYTFLGGVTKITNIVTGTSAAFPSGIATNMTFEGTSPLTKDVLDALVTATANYGTFRVSKKMGWMDIEGLITDKDEIRTKLGSNASTYSALVEECFGLYAEVASYYVFFIHRKSQYEERGLLIIFK
jgi:hypothetical protein